VLLIALDRLPVGVVPSGVPRIVTVWTSHGSFTGVKRYSRRRLDNRRGPNIFCEHYRAEFSMAKSESTGYGTSDSFATGNSPVSGETAITRTLESSNDLTNEKRTKQRHQEEWNGEPLSGQNVFDKQILPPGQPDHRVRCLDRRRSGDFSH
jgi:hypothetical protein